VRFIAVIWSYILPLTVFFITACLVSALSGGDRSVRRAILKAGDIILTERELQKRQDGKLVSIVAALLAKLENVLDAEKFIGYNIKHMLSLMGEKRQPERIYADHIVTALLAGCAFLAVPFITGFIGYILLYPVGVAVILAGQAHRVRKRFKAWQAEIVKDLPELIDKMRISLASGKDYITALKTVRDNSGPRLATMLEKLINDMQIMRPARALDEFATAFGMPVMVKFAAAVKVGIEAGYEQAEAYFAHIEHDIRELRKLALEELTRNKPEKVVFLKAVMVLHAIAAFALTAVHLFSNLYRIL